MKKCYVPRNFGAVYAYQTTKEVMVETSMYEEPETAFPGDYIVEDARTRKISVWGKERFEAVYAPLNEMIVKKNEDG